MRIQAQSRIGELGHVRATDDHESGVSQALHGHCVGGRGRTVGQQLGAGARDLALDVEQVFDRNGNAQEGRPSASRAAGAIRLPRGPACTGVIDPQEHAAALSLRVIDRGKRGFHQFDAGRATGLQFLGERS